MMSFNWDGDSLEDKYIIRDYDEDELRKKVLVKRESDRIRINKARRDKRGD